MTEQPYIEMLGVHRALTQVVMGTWSITDSSRVLDLPVGMTGSGRLRTRQDQPLDQYPGF